MGRNYGGRRWFWNLQTRLEAERDGHWKCAGHVHNDKCSDVDGAEMKLMLVYLRPDYRMPYLPTQVYHAFLKHPPHFSEEY